MRINVKNLMPLPRPTTIGNHQSFLQASASHTPTILLADRNDILSQGTYIEARRELYKELKPLINDLEQIFKPQENQEDKTELRKFFEKSIKNTKDFDNFLKESHEAVKKNSFSFKDILNIDNVVDIIEDIAKKKNTDDEGKKFHSEVTPFIEKWNKIFDKPNDRIKFVLHVLEGIDKISELDDAIQAVSSTPHNRNTDLALFSDKVNATAKNIREVGGNITAYAQSNNFEERELHKRAVELPDRFHEFNKVVGELSQNPKIQNNQDYVGILTNLYEKALSIMKFFAPEIKKGLEAHHQDESRLSQALEDSGMASSQFATKNGDIPTGKYTYSNVIQPVMHDKKQNEKSEKSDNYSSSAKPQETAGQEMVSKINTLSPDQQKMMQSLLKNNSQPMPAPTMRNPQMTQMPLDKVPLYGSDHNDQMINYLKKTSHNPQELLAPYSVKDAVRPAPLDDKYLRETQGMWDWQDYANRLKNKINAVSDIGQTMEEIALSGTGRPNPEMIALGKRSRRLSSLNNMMNEVPKINKATQDLEKAALEAQHSYMTGVNGIATQRLKNDIEGAHMQSEQQKAYLKGVEKLGLDAVEVSTMMAKNLTKITGMFNEIMNIRIDTVWHNIKSLVRGFKF